MSSICPFCHSKVAELKFQHIVLRICPNCFSTFFPCDRTMSFRTEITDKTRELWLKALEEKHLEDPVIDEPLLCIDHQKPLKQGVLPDYGISGKITTCCKMFHLPPSLTIQILKRTLEHPFRKSENTQKHHFLFIRLLDKLTSKIIGNEQPTEDPLDIIQYNIHFKDILE